ncbi:MAG: NADH:flavin oxidoreductase, partial [Syntrophobacteraceae bacterium]
MPNCREMTGDDFPMVAEAFGKAAARAREAGFDGVQIHAAHGHLLSEFLSPFFNRRIDRYGGSVENRARLLLEVAHN